MSALWARSAVNSTIINDALSSRPYQNIIIILYNTVKQYYPIIKKAPIEQPEYSCVFIFYNNKNMLRYDATYKDVRIQQKEYILKRTGDHIFFRANLQIILY